MSLVQIKQKRKNITIPLRTTAAVTSDKFFSLGMLTGAIGSVAVGAYLWLVLNGEVQVPHSYFSLKAFHASIQLHFFTGAFILGFLLQGSSRILESSKEVLPLSRLLFPLLFIALILRLVSANYISSILTSITFVGAFVCVAPVLLHTAKDRKISMGLPCAVSLVALAVGALYDTAIPDTALTVLWWGIISVILGIGQQFIGNILGGRRLSLPQTYVTYSFFCIAGVCLLLSTYFDNALAWKLFTVAATACFSFYIFFTQLYKAARLREPFALAFLIAWFWGWGSSCAALFVPHHADTLLHLWGTGLVATLIFAVSSRVVSHVTEVEVFPRRLFFLVIILWQIVPIGRGLKTYLALPPQFSWVVVTASAIVFVLWITRIARSLIYLITRLRRTRAQSFQAAQTKLRPTS